MTRGYLAALLYARSFATDWAPAVEREIRIDRGGRELAASLFAPRRPSRPAPAWVVFHGITRSGRSHPYLLRFARAMASTGAAVLVPDVPEWSNLDLSLEATSTTLDAAIRALDELPGIDAERVGLVGFSFGAPQVIITAADPELSRRIAGVVAFGGYYSVAESMRFQFNGVHELDGEQHHLSPDPYGRWVVGANYLTEIPEYADAVGARQALHTLASTVGERRLPANDPVFDRDKRVLAERLTLRDREIFELFAPPTDCAPDLEAGARMADALSEVMARVAPGLDPVPHLADVRVPVRLLHGTSDQLFPFTQTVKLGRAFPRQADVTTTVTGLFGHSSGGRRPSPLRMAIEGGRLLRALARIFRVV